MVKIPGLVSQQFFAGGVRGVGQEAAVVGVAGLVLAPPPELETIRNQFAHFEKKLSYF